MDRIRFSGSGLQAASPPSVIEPPSNQMPQCLSSHCELCTRFSGEDHGAAAKVVHQETEPDTTSTREMEYYEFLPHCGGVSHGDSEFAHRTAEDGSSSSPDFIDLSLKLSF
ncbi:uncharacterized protein LOC120267901 isoform X2 [Dioscorea cayenensis subsp. rotundata]|nr:uncharacterized protein LOC120267901 isoform X2 [Dioscorea cayenensis subsp. rotundata]